MADVNVVILSGRTTANPELTETAKGKPYTKFTLACNEQYKVGGKTIKKAHFFTIEAYGGRARVICEHVGKGQLLTIRGKLQQQRWMNSRGEHHRRIIILLDEVWFMGPPKPRVLEPEEPEDKQEFGGDEPPF